MIPFTRSTMYVDTAGRPSRRDSTLGESTNHRRYVSIPQDQEGDTVSPEQLDAIVKHEISQLRRGALFTAQDIRIFAKIDGYDIDHARRQTITQVISKYAERADDQKRWESDWTTWRVV